MIVPTSPAFLTGSPGPGELILLFLVILLLFGPRRLPEIARIIGRMLDQLRRASQDFREQIMEIGESTVTDISPVETEHEDRDKPHETAAGETSSQAERDKTDMEIGREKEE